MQAIQVIDQGDCVGVLFGEYNVDDEATEKARETNPDAEEVMVFEKAVFELKLPHGATLNKLTRSLQDRLQKRPGWREGGTVVPVPDESYANIEAPPPTRPPRPTPTPE